MRTASLLYFAVSIGVVKPFLPGLIFPYSPRFISGRVARWSPKKGVVVPPATPPATPKLVQPIGALGSGLTSAALFMSHASLSTSVAKSGPAGRRAGRDTGSITMGVACVTVNV